MSILDTNMLVCHGQERGHQEVYSDLSEIASLPTCIYQNCDKVFTLRKECIEDDYDTHPHKTDEE
jgi:hypothetical protein